MKLQYASFLVPLYPDSPEQEVLNRFIRGRRVIQTKKELIPVEGQHHWAFLVEYLDGGGTGTANTAAEPQKSRVDYKEILSEADFTVFSKLREVRKKLAEENGLPVYAVCTNEQLAEIAKRKPKTVAECMKIEGIGQGKAEKYVPAFIKSIAPDHPEDGNPPF
jgi:superfamily II DNA helicase RecQ